MKIPQLETGTLLIAAPDLKEDEFHRTVIYLTSYDENGAAGLVQNRPMKIFLGQIFQRLDVRHLLVLHNEIHGIPPLPATEAFIYAFCRGNGERTCLLVMKRTQTKIVHTSLF